MVLTVLCAASSSSRAQVFERVMSLTDARIADFGPLGGSPVGALVPGQDGNYFGVTRLGGAADLGTIYRITAQGEHTVLAEFSGLAGNFKGSLPTGGLTRGPDGNFYGTTSKGGEGNMGTVFRITPAGATTTLVEFTGITEPAKGEEPNAPLILAGDGNFYGTTRIGGTNGLGTVFRLEPGGVLTTIFEFHPGLPGVAPVSGLIEGPDGRLYGVTALSGIVYRLALDGSNFESLIKFTGIAGAVPGTDPLGPLTLGSDGNFYGVTDAGGFDNQGTVYRLTPSGGYTTLIQFPFGANNIGPHSPLYLGRDGNLYGTNNSKVVRMTNTGQATVVGNIGSTDGSEGALIEGLNGDFYGTTASGVSNGSIFRLSQFGSLETLVVFSGVGESAIPREPFSGLTLGTDGNFYGTLTMGSLGGGVFRMSPAGKFSVLANRISPFSSVVEDGDGNFFGTTAGDSSLSSKIYKMNPAGSILAEQSLPTNTSPFSPLIRATDGMLYGTSRSFFGGSPLGSIYRTTSALAVETLFTFTSATAASSGSRPQAALFENNDGYFYGTTSAGGASGGGTVFKMPPTGPLTTLVHFSGNGAVNKGRAPYGALIKATDGFFYGTTLTGGASDFGTVFRMTSGGNLTTLAEFTGESGAQKGKETYSGLVENTDGNLYGTTSRGGLQDLGTIFKITPAGQFSTVFEFASLPVDFNPYGTLIRDGEGNLYGTSRRPDGGIFRLIFPGRPLVFTMDPISVEKNSAVLQSKVNARGFNSNVTLEYGTDGINFPAIFPVRYGLAGFQTTAVGVTIGGLDPGVKYYYRFRATNSNGTKPGEIQSFTTLAEPIALVGTASQITTTSARFNGTINAQGFGTTVVFEWGISINSFPNQIVAVPATVTGNTAVSVSSPVAGLTKGQTYYYRLVASNAGGSVVSGAQAFTTLTEPIAIAGGANALSTTRAAVTGSVNPLGSNAAVSFEYGTDGISFPNSFSAVPASVSGSDPVPVSATLTGLQQGTTYFYRIRATGPGGTGLSTAGTFSLSILSGLVQVFPDLPPSASGTVTVNFDPPTRGAWRFAGETAWRNSGVQATHLASGQRLIEFLPIAGYNPPPVETLDVVSGTNLILNRFYFETDSPGSGGLTVHLKPEDLAAPGVPEVNRAQWRFVGESLWRDGDGPPVSSLTAGSYLVECKPVNGKVTPPAASISITNGKLKRTHPDLFYRQQHRSRRAITASFQQRFGGRGSALRPCRTNPQRSRIEHRIRGEAPCSRDRGTRGLRRRIPQLYHQLAMALPTAFGTIRTETTGAARTAIWRPATRTNASPTTVPARDCRSLRPSITPPSISLKRPDEAATAASSPPTPEMTTNS